MIVNGFVFFLLFGRCLGLVFRLPFGVVHAIDGGARRLFIHLYLAFTGSLAIPARHAVPAKTGQVHHIDILNVGAFLKMRDKAPEGGGFEFGLC